MAPWEVNTCPFKERNFFTRQFWRDIFSPELIISSVFLKVEKVLPRVTDRRAISPGRAIAKTLAIQGLLFFSEPAPHPPLKD